MVESALNAVIIASSFALILIQSSENQESERRKSEIDSWENFKKTVQQTSPFSDVVAKKLDEFTNFLEVKFPVIKTVLGAIIIITLTLHATLLHLVSYNDISKWAYFPISLLIGSLIAFYFRWYQERKRTKSYKSYYEHLKTRYEVDKKSEELPAKPPKK